MLATERIDTMSALTGRKAYVEGLARDVARGLGLEPVSMAPAELAGAMQRGDLLAAECGGAITSYALGLHAVAPYATGTSINRNGMALSLGIARALWDRLGESDQAMIAAAAAAEFQLSLAEEEAHRPMLYPDPAPERIWPLAAELSHAIRRVADAVVAHAGGADAQSRRINDSYAAFRSFGLMAPRLPRPSPDRHDLSSRRNDNGQCFLRRPSISWCHKAEGRRQRSRGHQTDTGLFLYPMNMTSMPSLAGADQGEPTDDQMQQIRELLVGDAMRRSNLRADQIEARLKDLEAEMTRRFDALSAQIEALATNFSADRRAAFDELAHGVVELGERIRHLSQR